MYSMVIYSIYILARKSDGVANGRVESCTRPNGDLGFYLPRRFCSEHLPQDNEDPAVVPNYSQPNRDQEKLKCCGSASDFKEVAIKFSSEISNIFGPQSLPNNSVCGLGISEPNIIGGNATTLGEFPWVAALEYKNRYIDRGTGIKCGGSLINSRYVLTAAHCLLVVEFELINVWLGDWDITTDPDCIEFGENTKCADPVLIVKVNKTIHHPFYNGKNHSNDIGMIYLNENVKFTGYIRPICLPVANPPISRLYLLLTVAGWGMTESGVLSNIKQKVDIPLLPNKNCSDILEIPLSDEQICAGGLDGQDSCQGDSGGPLMRIVQHNWYLEGIVSFGIGCGRKGVPAVYTRVSSHTEWIKEVLGEE